MKQYTIYRHVNKINGKSYIGQTCRELSKRWQNGHGYTADHQPTFYNAIQKYGWDNFDHEILETGIPSLSEANEREKFWIEHYHTWIYDPECNGYNITSGGDGSPGRVMSDELKAKLKKAVYCVELDRVFESLSSASEKTGCLISKISRCCKGYSNSTGGYHWQYVDESLAQIARQRAKDRQNKKQEYYATVGTPVYCITEDNKKISFTSRCEAAKWWFENYQPFGPIFYKGTYIKKINQSIAGKAIFTGSNQYNITEITNIKWFLGELTFNEQYNR